jgi:hypothetical protein
MAAIAAHPEVTYVVPRGEGAAVAAFHLVEVVVVNTVFCPVVLLAPITVREILVLLVLLVVVLLEVLAVLAAHREGLEE